MAKPAQADICQGMDVSSDAGKLDCSNKKFASADRLLNETYRLTMGGLEVSRRAVLKNEQIAWIKEKEAKCKLAGSPESLAAVNCKLQFTEQRLEPMKQFK